MRPRAGLLVAALLTLSVQPAPAQYLNVVCRPADLSARPLPPGVMAFGPWETQALLAALAGDSVDPDSSPPDASYVLPGPSGWIVLLIVRGPRVCYGPPIPRGAFEAAVRTVRGVEM